VATRYQRPFSPTWEHITGIPHLTITPSYEIITLQQYIHTTRDLSQSRQKTALRESEEKGGGLSDTEQPIVQSLAITIHKEETNHETITVR
jgi:hypothetical protein